MKPSLLYLEKDKEISSYVFKDLNLVSVFNDQIIEILSYPCSKQELLARQSVFLEMKNDSVFDAIVSCRSLIGDLKRVLILFDEAKTDIERLFLRVNSLELYLLACQAMAALQGSGRLGEVSNYFNQDYSKLSEAIAEAKSILNCITDVNLRLAKDQYIANKCQEEKPLFEELCDCAKELNIDFLIKKRPAAHPDVYISNVYCAVYKEELKKIHRLIEPFSSVDCSELLSYIPEFDFFIRMEEFGRKAERNRISRCIPLISETREFVLKEMYDFTLVKDLEKEIVPNDTYFCTDKAFFFLLGANGGGKTTYLRAVGSNLILFLAGCPVFAKSCVAYPFSNVCTHYPVDERFGNGGRLDDEKRRVEQMLIGNIQETFFLFNETFSGTNEAKGYALAIDTVEKLQQNGCFGLFVTHFHQVRETTIPILTVVVKNDEHHCRTYKITRTEAEAYSYAEDILMKYRMDRQSLTERLKIENLGDI